MWLFLILLFILGWLHSIVNLSLLKKRRYILISALGLSAINYGLFPLAIKINVQTINQAMHDANILSLACTYQIIEALAIMLLALVLIKSHYGGKAAVIPESSALFPSGIFLGGVFIFQVYFFNVIHELPFPIAALIFSLLILAMVGAGSWGIRKLISSWAWRVEIKILLSFFQMVLAMFIPLVVAGMRTNAQGYKINAWAVIVTLTCMMIPVIWGFSLKRYYCQENI